LRENWDMVKLYESYVDEKMKKTLDGYFTKYIEHRKYPGWSGFLPFYQIKCKRHGNQENYPMGYDGILECPLCQKERYGE